MASSSALAAPAALAGRDANPGHCVKSGPARRPGFDVSARKLGCGASAAVVSAREWRAHRTQTVNWPGYAAEGRGDVQNERVQRLLSVRLTRPAVKVAYVLAFVLLGIVLVRFVPVVGGVLRDLVQLAAIWYGSRVFRGRGEPVAPPRPRWKMTAWPKASGWIGALAVLGFASPGILELFHRVNPARYSSTYSIPGDLVELISLMLFWAIVAVAYLNSWWRLLGTFPPPKAVRERSVIRKPSRLD